MAAMAHSMFDAIAFGGDTKSPVTLHHHMALVTVCRWRLSSIDTDGVYDISPLLVGYRIGHMSANESLFATILA